MTGFSGGYTEGYGGDMTTWLPGAHVVQLSPGAGGGRFTNFLGVVLHVNQGNTQDAFFKAYNNSRVNPGSVVPNFQVHKAAAQTGDAGVRQYLPFDWQPWCQAAGNQTYAAVETEGFVGEPLTDYQIQQVAAIVKIYHDEMGMPYRVVDSPGLRGFGTHAMGGAAWGGHPCPGTIRAAQRQRILDLAQGGDDMPTAEEIADAVWAKQLQSQINKDKTFSAGFMLASTNKDANDAEKAALANPTADQIAEAVVAKLPANPGGGATPAEVKQAVLDALTGAPLIPSQSAP